MTGQKSVSEAIIAMFEAHGDELYGENVTQRQHALQSAYFAEQAGEDDAMIVACLLHDIGHMLSAEGEDAAQKGIDDAHEHVADPWLTQHFPPDISEPALLHVQAKRYLCAVDQDYLDQLSDASRLSLSLQGGPMTAEQVENFENHPHFERAIRLRKYDDLGKEVDLEVPPLESYVDRIEKLTLGPR